MAAILPGQLPPGLFPAGNRGFASRVSGRRLGSGVALAGRNFLRFSEDFSSSAWTSSGVSLANSAGSPGASDATLVSETTALVEHGVSQDIVAQPSRVLCLSAYVAMQNRRYVQLRFRQAPGVRETSAVFDLMTGTVLNRSVGDNIIGAEISGLFKGFWRIFLSIATPDALPQPTMQVSILAHNGSTIQYSGETTRGLRLWGAMLEFDATAPGIYARTLDNPGGIVPADSLSVPVLPGETEASVNLLAATENLASPMWSRTLALATEGPTPVPGVSAMSALSETSGMGQHAVAQPMAVNPAVGDAVAVSLFAAPGINRNQVWVSPAGEAPLVVNLSSGAVVSNGAATQVRVQPVGMGWLRIGAVFTKTNDLPGISAGIAASGETSFAGVAGNSILVWGLRADLGSRIWPYVPMLADRGSVPMSVEDQAQSAMVALARIEKLAAEVDNAADQVIAAVNSPGFDLVAAAAQAAADRVATGQDRTQTGQDRAQTGADRAAVAADRAATAAAVASANGVLSHVGRTDNPHSTTAAQVGAYTTAQTDALVADRAPALHGHSADQVADSVTRVWMAPAERSKLAGIADGATANATDAALRNRSTHTGTQPASTITGLSAVATTGAYADLSGRPTLGTAAGSAIGDFAPAVHSHPSTAISDSSVVGRGLLTAADAAAQRTLLGLGGAALLPVGTAAGTVAAGDDARLSNARAPTAHTHPAADISDSTVTGRALLTAASSAAARTAIEAVDSAGAAAAAPVQSVAGRSGAVVLTLADVPGAASLASPTFTGTPTAPTPAASTNTTQIATTAFVWSLPAQQQIADSTVTGGNARGANAVDWQSSRTSASQVASAASSVIGGGQNNTAAGQRATVGGGNANTASGPESTVAGGSSNTASGQHSVVAGGSGNTASGLQSAVLGGTGNQAPNTLATVAGGVANNANASRAWIPGGDNATARGHYGRGAWSSGVLSVQGDAQAGEFVLRRITTDATATRLTADNAAPAANNTVNLPNNGTYRLKLLVVAQQTAGSAGTVGDCASWEANVLLKRGANAAATAFVGGMRFAPGATVASVTANAGFAPGIADAGAAGWLLTLGADTTNGGLLAMVTGENNKTIRAVARVMAVEVTA